MGWLDLLPAGLAIADSVVGYNANKDKNDALAQNSAIQNAIALQMLQMQLSPTSNIYGDVTGYDPVTGFYIDPSKRTSELTALNDINSFEAPFINRAAASQALSNAADNQDARQLVSGAQIRAQGTSPYTADGIKGALLGARLQGAKEGFDNVRGSLGRTALRSGSSAAGSIAGQLGKEEGDAFAKARASSFLDGVTNAENIRNQRLTTNSNIFNQMAARTNAGQTSGVGAVDTGAGLSAQLSSSPGANAGYGASQALANSASSLSKMSGASNFGDMTNLFKGINAFSKSYDDLSKSKTG